MKSQVAVEYLIIVSVAIMILLALSLTLSQSFIGYRDNTKLSKASDAVKKLGESADWVYSQGPPAKQTLQIFIPDGLESVSLDGNTILFKIRTSAGISDVYHETVAPLNGSLPTNSGYYYVTLTAFSAYVNVSVVG